MYITCSFYVISLHVLLMKTNLQADADGNGTIDYEEFITATMHINRMDREEHLYTAFQYFDKDNSGYGIDINQRSRISFLNKLGSKANTCNFCLIFESASSL